MEKKAKRNIVKEIIQAFKNEFLFSPLLLIADLMIIVGMLGLDIVIIHRIIIEIIELVEVLSK